MSGFSSSPMLRRGVCTPSPSRPRLFTRVNADRKSPTPPARLAPLTPVVTPVDSPEFTPHLWESNEEKEGVVPHHGAAASQNPNTHRSLHHHHCSHRDENNEERTAPGPHTPPRAEPLLLPPSKVTLTPPQEDSADWTGHGPIESMMAAAKRERFVSSADTQHSLASSSTPPPRCKRAVNDHGDRRAETRAMGHRSAATRGDAVAADESGKKQVASHGRLRLSGSTSRSSTSRSSSGSRDAISDSSTSDFVATVAATANGAAAVAAPTAAAAAAAAAADAADASTGVQCLVLDDSVDSAAVVPPDQLQCLVDRTGGCAEEPPTPYQRRLITAEVLRDWTGWEDLELVLATQLRVDAEAMIGVDQIGHHLTRLSSLKLNGSRIPRLRQLGTGFHALKYLWLNGCHLTDLRGLASCCPALVELYVSFNYVSDVTPVMELSATLEVLDVEGNLLDDAAALGFVLASLHKLSALSLQGNPLTCEHQTRVREAYAAMTAADGDDTSREQKNKVAAHADGAAVTAAESGYFTHVLRAWVRRLVPSLQTLNDDRMQQDSDDVDAALLSSTLNTAVTTATAARASTARAVHADPLEDRLADELRLVEACVRETDPFDPLREAVEEANQLTYTRPSTSCNGARPRLAPATAMGASRPSTSARSSSTAMSRRLGSASATDASVLTTGAVLAGSATASLRRRLATPTPTPTPTLLTLSLEGAAAGTIGGDDSEAATAATGVEKTPSTRVGELTDEDARVAALLVDDSEEDEWEHYKSSLLLSSSSAAGAATATTDATDAHGAKRPSFFSSSAATQLDDDATPAGTALSREDDGFDKELKSEWSRLRLRMAKAGCTL